MMGECELHVIGSGCHLEGRVNVSTSLGIWWENDIGQEAFVWGWRKGSMELTWETPRILYP